MDKYTLYFDGCSKGNPGPSGAGFVLQRNGIDIYKHSVFVGEKETNNAAEYTALFLGIQEAIHRNIKHIVVKGDSELVIRQMNGSYKVKSEKLKVLYDRCKEMEKEFEKITFEHIPRTENYIADQLSNQGILLSSNLLSS